MYGGRTTTGACWLTFGAALCLFRDVFATVSVDTVCFHFNTSNAGSQKYDPFYDASQSVLTSLKEKHTRNSRPRISPGSSQGPFTGRCAALHPSCRGDTDDVIVSMHCSTMNGAVPFPRKRLCLKGTAGHGRVMCLRTKSNAAIGGTNNYAIVAEQDAKSGSSTSRLQDELCSDVEAAGSPTASNTRTNHSEVQIKPSTATTPRVSGDFTADADQQRLELALQLEQQRRRRRASPWSGQNQTLKTAKEVQDAHPQVPQDGSGKTTRSVVAGGAVGVADDGLPILDANCLRTTRWTPPW